MRTSLSPRRRKVVALAGVTAALSGILPLLHVTHASDSRLYTVAGLIAGVFTGCAIVIFSGKRSACSRG